MKKIANNIQKSSENLNSLFTNKKSFVKSFFIMLFVVLISIESAYAQQCSFKLSTTSNTESVNDEGRTYFIQLQNSSNEEIKVNLSVSNNNTGKNPDETDSKDNVILNATVLNEAGLVQTGSVQLKPNEILKLQVKVTVPAGTSIEHWNSLLFNATSDGCTGYSSSLILHTFIPNPNEN